MEGSGREGGFAPALTPALTLRTAATVALRARRWVVRFSYFTALRDVWWCLWFSSTLLSLLLWNAYSLLAFILYLDHWRQGLQKATRIEKEVPPLLWVSGWPRNKRAGIHPDEPLLRREPWGSWGLSHTTSRNVRTLRTAILNQYLHGHLSVHLNTLNSRHRWRDCK